MLVITWLINPLITLYFLALPSFLVHLDFNILTNCIAHSWGYRNFDTPDTSRNNQWLDIIQAGEGLHNNHHAHPQLYDFAVKSGEFDFSAWVIEKYVAIDGEQTRQGKLRID
jgi:fatty-acid desaturase